MLNYHGSPEDADDVFLGEDHFDRSRFTIAGEENRPGLHGAVAANSVFQPGLTHEELDAYSAQARATPIDYQPGVGKFFVGAGFAYMDSSAQHAAGNMRPLLHGVDNLTPGVPRRAFVSFINERLGTPNLLIPTLYETKLRSVHAAIDDPTLITEGLAKQLTDARRTVPGYPLASLVADQQ